VAPWLQGQLIMHEPAKVTADGKFKNKLEETIYNHPNYKKQKF